MTPLFPYVLLGALLVLLFGMLDRMARKEEAKYSNVQRQVEATQPFVYMMVVVVGAGVLWLWGMFHIIF